MEVDGAGGGIRTPELPEFVSPVGEVKGERSPAVGDTPAAEGATEPFIHKLFVTKIGPDPTANDPATAARAATLQTVSAAAPFVSSFEAQSSGCTVHIQHLLLLLPLRDTARRLEVLHRESSNLQSCCHLTRLSDADRC